MPLPHRGRGGRNQARAARSLVRAATRREHGYIPTRVSHQMRALKTSTIIQFRLLATASILSADAVETDTLTLTVTQVLEQLGLSDADLKILKLKAYLSAYDITDPPELFFTNGLNATGNQSSEVMRTSLVQNFTSQLAVASIHPPQDDWLDHTASFGLQNILKSVDPNGGLARIEVTVQCRINLPTLSLNPDTKKITSTNAGLQPVPLFSWSRLRISE